VFTREEKTIYKTIYSFIYSIAKEIVIRIIIKKFIRALNKLKSRWLFKLFKGKIFIKFALQIIKSWDKQISYLEFSENIYISKKIPKVNFAFHGPCHENAKLTFGVFGKTYFRKMLKRIIVLKKFRRKIFLK